MEHGKNHVTEDHFPKQEPQNIIPKTIVSLSIYSIFAFNYKESKLFRASLIRIRTIAQCLLRRIKKSH